MVDRSAADEQSPQRLKPKSKAADHVSLPFILFSFFTLFFTNSVVSQSFRWLWVCRTHSDLLSQIKIVIVRASDS